MAQTKLMRADEMAYAFNGTAERKYWQANLAGTRVNPEVHFVSRASMVRVVYRVSTNDFTAAFSKSAVAFGDYLSSLWRSMEQILAALKAAGMPASVPLDERAVLRIEYDPKAKETVVFLANMGDAWDDAEPTPFKVSGANVAEIPELPLDAPSTDD